MRRIAALSAVVLLAIGLAACGDDDDGTIAADDDTESTTTKVGRTSSIWPSAVCRSDSAAR